MPRPSVNVDEKALRHAVEVTENNGPLPNLGALYTQVIPLYKQQTGVELASYLVASRIKQFKIKTKTQPGKAGSGNLRKSDKPIVRQKKGAKFASNPQVQQSLREIKAETPERFWPLVNHIANGSRAAANKLKCLECSNYETREIGKCVVKACPMWPFRPYQRQNDSDTMEADEEIDTEQKYPDVEGEGASTESTLENTVEKPKIQRKYIHPPE
jgi:hypothetical protein